MFVRLRRRQVDFVEDGDDGQIMVDGHEEVGQSLGFDALGGVHQKDGSFAGGQGPGHFVGEVHVAGGVDHAQGVFLPIESPRHPHGLGLDGDPPLLLDLHPVQEAVVHIAGRHDAGKLEDAVGHGRFAMVDVGDDAEIPHEGLVGEAGLISFRHEVSVPTRDQSNLVRSPVVVNIVNYCNKDAGKGRARYFVVVSCYYVSLSTVQNISFGDNIGKH